MNKHILDRPAPETDGKIVRTFAEVERLSGHNGPGEAAMALLRRAQDRPPVDHRLARYTRIESQRS
ncbi:hypothetical protein PSA7680_03238 [Pseudoruegeria aquimaris]|uniref:Uncharacterized protein n=1 Tax=Pseudoruegeria aquimaris TaxID=393663 RepID=A0A1Y5TDR1_9RHOB|nr:hypothetical protein [Pseudoruegeria aquimaris]SLN61400.1 hypothetical protein PSA7680_03238 [Pseudoruegeria aquimaris]